MKLYKLKNFTRGWLIGDFSPSILRTRNFEMGVKHYKKGDREAKHVHKKADEITVVVNGTFKMNGKPLGPGDIVWLKRRQPADFVCLSSGTIAVVKTPSMKDDKYLF